MTVSNLPIFPQVIESWMLSLLPANTTSTVVLITAGANGTKVESITATSNNITDLALDLWVNNGNADTLLASVYVPANSGNNSNPALPTVDVLRSGQLPGLAYDANGNRYIYLASGITLKCSANIAVGTGKVLNIWATGGNY
jgi:hypothetical protein